MELEFFHLFQLSLSPSSVVVVVGWGTVSSFSFYLITPQLPLGSECYKVVFMPSISRALQTLCALKEFDCRSFRFIAELFFGCVGRKKRMLERLLVFLFLLLFYLVLPYTLFFFFG